ncbi:MAG TPA: serine hydrolase domain-containing protein, partial [Cyclobacteriaceae bacterium]|nr:serine hydrolase domain-containing protein [Cyclobacteriaceae bacterium]
MKKVFLVLLVLLSSPMAFAQQLSLQELLDSLQVIITKEKIPGISLALVHKDSIIFAGGVGYANLEKQEPVNADHLFRIGSVSKTFTSLAIMRLIEQGKFSLNSKLRDIALEINFRNDWEDTHPIRVINLLEHTTGFDDMHFKDMKNYTSIRRDAMSEVRAQQNSLYTRWRPGTR